MVRMLQEGQDVKLPFSLITAAASWSSWHPSTELHCSGTSLFSFAAAAFPQCRARKTLTQTERGEWNDQPRGVVRKNESSGSLPARLTTPVLLFSKSNMQTCQSSLGEKVSQETTPKLLSFYLQTKEMSNGQVSLPGLWPWRNQQVLGVFPPSAQQKKAKKIKFCIDATGKCWQKTNQCLSECDTGSGRKEILLFCFKLCVKWVKGKILVILNTLTDVLPWWVPFCRSIKLKSVFKSSLLRPKTFKL